MAVITSTSCARASHRGFLLAMWLALSILLAQAIAMGFHHHDLSAIDTDCPSCQLAAVHPTPTPSTPVTVPIPVLAFAYQTAAEPVLQSAPAICSYLNPYQQAPPRCFVSL